MDKLLQSITIKSWLGVIIYLIPMIFVLITTFIFLLSKPVRKYFSVNVFHVGSMILLSSIVVFLATINPITDPQKVNAYYTSNIDNFYPPPDFLPSLQDEYSK